MTEQTSNLYALLIGVDCYMSNSLPDGSSYRNLRGCVRDINHVEAFLKDVRKVPDHHILKLTSSPSQEDYKKPSELPQQLPTRNNIIDFFRKIGEVAPNGSQVYIHYSGHGGRAKTIYEDIKGPGEIDEGLVPTDIGTSEGQYLRDIELAHLLQELVKKGLAVTLVLDCCHSGGATRSIGDAGIRGMDVEDDKPLQPSHQQVASTDQLQQTWAALTGVGTRGLKAGGLPESEGYVVLAACRQHESAHEYPFNRQTKEYSGALTHWLLNTLRQPNQRLTYKNLYDRINAQIHSQFSEQTPLLLGDGSRVIFDSDRGATVFAVPVMEVKQTDTGETQAVLGVGQVNGITKGAKFAIYPQNAADLSQKEGRIAVATVIQLRSSNSLCKLEAIEGKEQEVELGDQAVQIAVAPSLVRKVSLLSKDATDEPIQKALATLKTAITESGKGWVELDETVPEGDNGEGIDYFVEVTSEEYRICDSGGVLLKNMTPVLKINDETAPTKVVKRLIHLAKHRAAITIDNMDSSSSLAGKLSVKWLGTSDIYDQGATIPKTSQLKKIADPTKPTATVGDYIFLSICNHSNVTLNVAVLNFEANWAIEQIYPGSPMENFFTLEPGEEEKIPLLLSIEEEGEQVENTIKVFATKGQANFRCLELPSLDEKIVSKGASTRSSLNPLDALLAAIDDEQPKTRRMEAVTSASQDWTAQQLTLTITKY